MIGTHPFPARVPLLQNQCELCRELLASGQRVICIGCTSAVCSPCHITESDLLSAMLTAAVEYQPKKPLDEPQVTVRLDGLGLSEMKRPGGGPDKHV